MPAPEPSEKILIRSVNWLGDAVMTIPALLRLRESKPDAHIALLTLDSIADLWKGFTAIDSLLTFKRGDSPLQTARRLRQHRFSASLTFPNSTRSALESFLARIPVRTGYTRTLGSLLLTHPIPRPPTFVAMHKRSETEIKHLINTPPAPPEKKPSPSAHHIHHYLHLAAALGANPEPIAPSLPVSIDELTTFRQRFSVANSQDPIYGLNPGAAYGSAKCWPADRFIATALKLHERGPCQIWVFGGKTDVETAARIEKGIQMMNPSVRTRNLAGKTDLRELCAALKLCQTLITNDSGPMHLAAALGTRVVVPFGSTSPELTGPGLPHPGATKADLPPHALIQGIAPCAPCFLRSCPIDHRCMTSITVNEIVQACD